MHIRSCNIFACYVHTCPDLNNRVKNIQLVISTMLGLICVHFTNKVGKHVSNVLVKFGDSPFALPVQETFLPPSPRFFFAKSCQDVFQIYA